MKTCLLVVDMQEGFTSEHTAHVAARIRTLLEADAFDHTVFTRFHNAPASPYRRLLGWQKLSSAAEQALNSELADLAQDVVEKDVYTAISPALLERLRAEEFDAVFIAGVDTDCCVLTTAVDLFQAGIRPCVLSHYCASNGGGESHTAALVCLGRLIGLHNVIGGEIHPDSLAAILETPFPAELGPGLEKTAGFVATRADEKRLLELDEAPATARVLEFLDLDFRDSLDASVGVWEQYTLREHVYMVLGQFERYFAGKDIAGIPHGVMLLLLGLHDIGKPAAVRAGDKKLQHEYTLRMAEAFLAHLGYDDTDDMRRLARAMSLGDPIGGLLRTGDTAACVASVEEAAAVAGMPADRYLEFLLAYFLVDASSYTADATMPDGRPGFESLDWMFEFDHENATLGLSPEPAAKIAALREALD